MIRGIEGCDMFQDDLDRQDFLDRISKLREETGARIAAWALMINHVHLLLFSGHRGISTFMRRLLTGYVVSYNRRHHRAGHLFQNRYKSIVCDADAYLLELVRYIHLNPLRSGVVKTLKELERYRWSGHGVLVGKAKNEWQERDYILRMFARNEAAAMRAYRRFMEEGKDQGQRPELIGGGLTRSLGGWSKVDSLKSKEPMEHDARILGSGDFVSAILKEAEKKCQRQLQTNERPRLMEELITETCREEGIDERELRMGGWRRKVSRVRARIS